MDLYIILAIQIFLGTFMRRVVGGYAPAFLKGEGRSVRVTVWLAIVGWPSIITMDPFRSINLFGLLVPEYVRPLVVLLCAGAYLTVSADFTRWWLMALRYSLLFPVCVLYGYWWGLLAGPGVALADLLSQKFGGSVPTPFDTKTSKFWDGWEAAYELVVGALGAWVLTAAPFFAR